MLRTLTLLLAFCSLSAFRLEPTPPPVLEDWQVQMLEEVNALRTRGCRCGRKRMPPAPPLRWSPKLAQAARAHARDMNRHNYFSHQGRNGSSISDRVEDTGYRWQAVGENIAWNYSGVSAVVQGWRESPGHCRNMMSSSFTEMGAAIEGVYYVQDFGRPR